MGKTRSVHWKSEPEEHDFPAAANFLSLLFPVAAAATLDRICASFHIDEDADIPCRITDLP